MIIKAKIRPVYFVYVMCTVSLKKISHINNTFKRKIKIVLLCFTYFSQTTMMTNDQIKQTPMYIAEVQTLKSCNKYATKTRKIDIRI